MDSFQKIVDKDRDNTQFIGTVLILFLAWFAVQIARNSSYRPSLEHDVVSAGSDSSSQSSSMSRFSFQPMSPSVASRNKETIINTNESLSDISHKNINNQPTFSSPEQGK